MNTSVKIKISLIACMLILQLSGAFAGNSGYQIFTLYNGLNILVKPVRSAPVVAVNVWVKAGSITEQPDEEGYSQLLERMIFKGTANYPDNKIEKIGAKHGSFIANDYACYHVVGAKKHFAKMLEIQIDAIFNSNLDEDALSGEIQIAIDELKKQSNDPNSRVFELIMTEAFTIHPYRRSVKGYLESIEAVNRNKLMDYYKRLYNPKNMWIVIVGDINTDEAIGMVRKYTEHISNDLVSIQKIVKEPEQREKRTKIVYEDVQNSYIRLGWKTPGIESDDRFVLEIIAKLIGGGKSSWLWNQLVKESELADSAGTAFYSSRYPMIFQIGGVTTPRNAKLFISEAIKVVDKLVTEDIDSEEIEKIKRQIIAEDIFNRETAENQALNYGHHLMISDVKDIDNFAWNIQSVTLEDIKRVAATYFVDSKLTIVRLEPEYMTENTFPELLTLDNGIRLILNPNHSSQTVAVSVKVAAGSLVEKRGEAGIAAVVAEMLLRGTKNRSAQEIVEAFESIGARISLKVDKSFVSLDLQCLSDDFIPSFQLLLDILNEPDFSHDNLLEVKEQVVSRLKAENDDLLKSTSYAALKLIFGDISIAHSSDGKAEDIKKLRVSKLKEFHKKYYVGSNMVIAIVGDFYISEDKERLLSEFARFKKGKPVELEPFNLKDLKNSEISIKKNWNQGQAVYAARTFSTLDPNIVPIEIAQAILSGGRNSRLLRDLRLKDDSISKVLIDNVSMVNDGYLIAAVISSVESIASTTIQLKKEIEFFCENKFTDQEFEDAKEYLIGQCALSLVDNSSLANNFAGNEFMGKGFDYFDRFNELVKNTTREQVEAVSKSYLLASGTYSLAITAP